MNNNNERYNGLFITNSVFDSGTVAPAVTLQALVGCVLDFATTDFADFGDWLYCNGRVLEASKFPLLFKKIGYKFGGSGEQFAIPDLRGMVAACASTSEPIGKKEGAKTHTLSVNEMPRHGHSYTNPVISPHAWTQSGIIIHNDAATVRWREYPTTNGGTTTQTGSGQAHNNMQPTIYLAKFIYCL